MNLLDMWQARKVSRGAPSRGYHEDSARFRWLQHRDLVQLRIFTNKSERDRHTGSIIQPRRRGHDSSCGRGFVYPASTTLVSSILDAGRAERGEYNTTHIEPLSDSTGD